MIYMACATVTLVTLELSEGYTEEELAIAVAAYVAATFGETAVLNGFHLSGDEVHLCLG